MFPSDIDNMTDRELLIAMRIETYHLNKKVTEFIDEQKDTNEKFSDSITGIDNRVGALEKSACCESAVTTWWNSKIVQIGIVTGVILGVLGFIIDLARRGS